MVGVRRFMCRDLLSFNGVNLDVLTETYNMPFYQTYLARWPEYFQKVVGPEGQLMGYGEAPPASSPPPYLPPCLDHEAPSRFLPCVCAVQPGVGGLTPPPPRWTNARSPHLRSPSQ